MLRVGLTGGIGAGKSTVTAILEAEGAVIVDADKVAREVVEPGTPGLDLLAAEFGEGILQEDGSLDRAELARLAFVDPERTAALNAITHPLIGERTAELMAAAPEESILVHDMPLIVEGGMAPSYHLVIVVDAPAEIRLERLTGQRGMDADDAQARISRQASDEQRYEVADVLVDNSGDRASVEERVRQLCADRLRPFNENLRTRTGVRGSTEVVPHRPEWAAEARRAIARLEFLLGDQATRVDHVGPTAQPDTAAPDVVDLEVIVPDDVAGAVATLRKEGYVPDPGSDGRPLLRWCDPARPLAITVRGEGDDLREFELLMSEVMEDDPELAGTYTELGGPVRRTAAVREA